jgi:EAL domain-containing protein (putative c-di-GMP-specific phosphodiesterase class I)
MVQATKSEVALFQLLETMRDAVTQRRYRALLWTLFAFLTLGILDAASPLDDVLRVLRNHVRSHASNGDIVVVTIDGPTIAAQGEWPWPRDKVAGLVNKIDAAGARQIAFEHVFVPTGSPEQDKVLANAFRALPGKAVIGARFDKDPVTLERRFQKPAAILASAATTAGSSLYFNGFGHAWHANYRVKADGEEFPSLAATLAGKQTHPAQPIFIDYSIDADSIPQISAAQILDGRAGAALKGKIALVSNTRSPESVPGTEPIPIAFINAIAAETMMEGEQAYYGWWPAFVFAAFASFIIWAAPRRWAVMAITLELLTLVTCPIILEDHGIYLDPAIGMLMAGTIILMRAWRSYRRGDARVNPLTGLPNLLALKEHKLSGTHAIVAVRIKNYAELVAALAQNEDVLATQIAARLNAGNLTSLFHGDDGIFCWIAPASAPDELSDQLEAIHSFFMMPITVGGWQVDVSIAFGIDTSGSPDLGARFASALVAADEAAAAGHRWKYYDPARLNEAEWNMSLLGRLDTAIESGEVWVAYQPKLDLKSGKVTGAEALVRWTHPQRGAISPEEFVSVAEANGRIDKLTYFVLEQALMMVASTGNRFNVAVNLSAQMFGRKDFVGRLRELLERHKVPGKLLTMEITESAAVEKEEELFATVNALTALGVIVSIDDYGTGFCTLEYLKKIKASELKIDRGFVAAMDRNRSDRVLVNATIELAHSLGHSVVAEGVETQETLEMLQSMGCDKAQGFFISRPMPRDEFMVFIGKKPALRAA